MERRSRHIIKKIGILCLVAVTLCGYLGYVCTHREQLTRESTATVVLEAGATEATQRTPLEKDVEWRQSVTMTASGELQSLLLRLVELPEELDGDLEISIQNEAGTPLYTTRVAGASLLDGTYLTMSGFTQVQLDAIGVPVKRQERLTLCLTFSGAHGPAAVTCERTGENTLQIGSRTWADHFLPLECRIAVRTRYHWVAGLLALLLALSAYGACRQRAHRVMTVWAELCCLLLPVFVLLYAAWLEGNTAYLTTGYMPVNLLLIYALYAVFLGVAGQRLGSLLFLGCGTGVALANYYMDQFRGQPVLFTDLFSLRTAATVAGSYTLTLSFSVVTVAALAVLLAVAVVSGERRRLTGKKRVLWRCAAAAAGAAVLIVTCCTTAADLSGWSIRDSVTQYGWLYTNAKLVKSYRNAPPGGYDREETQAFIASQAGTEPTLSNPTPTNLIVIMDESFADLSVLGEITTDREVLPFFHSLQNSANVEKGWLGVHVIGGGTATTEWEVLTGGNSTFMDIGSLNPYNLLTGRAGRYNTINLCTAATEAGYYPVAMHPFYGKNYGRDTLYPLFGFKEFQNIDNSYQGAEWIRWCVSDEADFEALIRRYESKPEDKLFVFNVTMQNHGAYSYPMEEYTVHADAYGSDELNSYLSLVHYTDRALEKLIGYFSAVEEPTMIVFFGDHQPALTDGVYEQIFGSDTLTPQQSEAKYVTPYLIWSNYSRETCGRPYMNAAICMRSSRRRRGCR